EQAPDRVIDELLAGDRLDVAGFDGSEHIGELLQPLERQRLAALGDSADSEAHEDAPEESDEDPAQRPDFASAHARSRYGSEPPATMSARPSIASRPRSAHPR